MPNALSLKDAQFELTAHLRDPSQVAAPAGIEGRRLKIYNDLIYNNVDSFLSGGFPVTRSLYRDEDWHSLVRSFLRDYRCRSPYFVEISQEFIQFIMQQYTFSPVDPPFLLELAHYEWVELALDVAEEEVDQPNCVASGDPVTGIPVLSPLAWSLNYQYPVHNIGPGYELDEPPAEPTFLVVYRDRLDKVGFLESNAATARLLELVRDNESKTGQALLEELAQEMNADSITSVVDFGAKMLRQFIDKDILSGSRQRA